MSQLMNIMESLPNNNPKSVLNNSNLLFSPLVGGKIKDDIEDFYGMLVTASKKQIKFYVLTPHQYYTIFSISTEIDIIHPLVSKTVLDEENEIKMSGIRDVLFQNNELFNFNVGIDQTWSNKLGEISIFEVFIHKEIFCMGDTHGNIAIYK
jgi:hypothetical protein